MSLNTWAAEKLHVDFSYLIRGSFWQSLVQGSNAVLGLALSVAFARFFPKETYGTYAYVLSIAGLLATFTLNGMDVAVIQSVARGAEGSVKNALGARIRWGFLGAFIGFLLAAYYFVSGNAVLGFAFFIAASFTPFLDSFAIFYDILKGRKLFNVDARYSIAVQIIVTVLLVTTLLVTNELLPVLFVYFFAYTLSHLYFYRRTIRRFPLNQEKNPGMIAYGKYMTIMRAFTTAAAYLDKILLFHFIGPAELAIYSFALAPVKKVEGLLAAVPNLALPRFAARPREEIKKYMKGKIIKFSAFVAVTIALYTLFVPFLFRLLFPQYTESIRYAQLLGLTLVSVPFSLIYTYFQSHALTHIIFSVKLIINILQVVLLGVLIYFYGLLGAIAARVLLSIAVIPLNLILFKES